MLINKEDYHINKIDPNDLRFVSEYDWQCYKADVEMKVKELAEQFNWSVSSKANMDMKLLYGKALREIIKKYLAEGKAYVKPKTIKEHKDGTSLKFITKDRAKQLEEEQSIEEDNQ